MSHATVLDLADCTEYRQAIRARPPAIAHGTLILLVALLGGAVTWAAVTRANLVVRGTGRVRPATTPVKVFNTGRGEVLSASAGGRITEVRAREGDRVRRGDILVLLETGRLDNEIAKQERLIHTAEDERARIEGLESLLVGQFEAARTKARADLDQAIEAIRRAAEQRSAEIRLAELALAEAEREQARTRSLVGRSAVPLLDLDKARSRTHEAEARSARARIPIDESGGAVARGALEVVEKDYPLKRDELRLKAAVKRGEIEAARLELANLHLERQQAVISAPIDGIVTAGDLKVGDILVAGKPVVEIAEEAGFLFEAAVPSEEIGHVRSGMPVRIKLDAFDYQRYGTLEGTVCFVSPDSSVAEGQGKVVYTVRAGLPRLDLGRGAYRGRAQLGMSGVAEVITARESLLSLLLQKLHRTISL